MNSLTTTQLFEGRLVLTQTKYAIFIPLLKSLFGIITYSLIFRALNTQIVDKNYYTEFSFTAL